MKKPVIESVAKALITNAEGRYLILTLGEHKQKPHKSYTPDLPGGIVDPGETEYEAVVREVREETGIVLSSRDVHMIFTRTEFFADENKSVTKFLFRAQSDSASDVALSWEHSDYEWVIREELHEKSFGKFYDEAVNYCMDHGVL